MGSPQDPDHGRRPKRINAFLVLYDAPPHRDWLVWWTVAWTAMAGWAIGTTPDETRSSSLSIWLEALLAAVVFGVLLGLCPAYLRLLARRVRYRRSVRRGDRPAPGQSDGAPDARTGPPRPPTGSLPSPHPHLPPPPHAPPGRPTAAGSQPGGSVGGAPRPSGVAARVQPPVARTTTPPPEGASTAAGLGPARRAAPTGGATPIGALDLSTIRDSEELSRARAGMPYPVARAVRAVQAATTLRDAYDGILRGSEALSVALGVVVTTWARSHGATTPQLQDLRAAMLGGGISQGHWIQAFASMERAMAQHPDALVGLTDALKRGKGGSGLVADLNELVQERNRWAHGASPRNELEAAERLRVVFPVFVRASSRAQFLAESPWVLTNDSKYRRREADFQIHASLAMGDHPDFEHTTFVSPLPLAEDVFYLRARDEFLDMTPLVVMRQCPTCHQREVAYADRLDQQAGVALKTFDRGHVLFDRGLVDEVRAIGTAGAGGPASDIA